ncbi:GtrA family protein [Tritonibacter scottomollicae]|uniref:GtrA family protein n=1 Tax=Tritonibacter scottomollicae TaxID=483013 RepID=A0ABZ0HAX8_TRISK|nr:GtrA family protein [Tritonibacter scottomollicae]WOI31631.1 GtrA family protein [Tritonibacter scottomollicae]
MASDSLRQNLIQVSRFSAVGVVNTLVGLAIIWGSMYLGLGYVKANILGYAVGLIVSFTLNSRWTFSQRAKEGGSTSATYALRFLIAFLIAWGANYMVLIFGVRSFNLSQYIAQLGAMATYTVVFFLLCRAFVFSAKK